MPPPPPPAAYPDAALLAEGGMGAVYRADEPALARHVAVKVARGARDEGPWARLRREARVLARVAGAGVPAIHRLGEDADGRPFLVMDLIEGEDLETRLRGCRSASDRRALLPHLRDAAGVLARAHRRGVVHRDVTAANLRVDPEGRTWVLDWGLARPPQGGPADPLQTRAGARLGTPRTMSPEQAAGVAVDARADVWALGVLLWELLAGRPAYPGETAEDVLPAILAGPPDPAPLAGHPAALRAVVERALAPLPDRLPDAGAFAAALGDALAPPPAAPARRWPLAATLLAVPAAAALGHALAPGPPPAPAAPDPAPLAAAAWASADAGRPAAAAHLARAALDDGGPDALRGLLLVPEGDPHLLSDAPGPTCAIGEILSVDGAWLTCAEVDETHGWRIDGPAPTRAWVQPVEVHQLQPAGPDHIVGQAPAYGSLVRLDRETGAPDPTRIRALAQGPLAGSAHPVTLLGTRPRVRFDRPDTGVKAPGPCDGAPAWVRADGTEAWACPDALVLRAPDGATDRRPLPADVGTPVRLVEAPDGAALGVLTDRGHVGIFQDGADGWWGPASPEPTSALALAPGGTRYARGGVHGATVREARDGAAPWHLPGRAYHLGFSDAQTLVQVGPGRVRRWALPDAPPQPPAPVRALAWTDAGLVAALSDGTVQRHTTPDATPEPLGTGHALAAHPEGGLAIADGGAVRDLAGRRAAADPACARIAWLDAHRIACASRGPGPLVLDLRDGSVDRRHVQPETLWVDASGADGQAALLEWSARVWSLDAAPSAPLVARGRHPWTGALALGPDGRVALSDRLAVRVLEPGAETPSATWPTRSRVRAMAWSPDGRHLAALGYLGMVHVFDTRDGTEAARFPAGAAARALAFSPDGRQLAVGGRTLRRYPLHALDGDPAALRRASEQRWGTAEGSLGP